MPRRALGLALLLTLLAWPSAAAAQDPPPCTAEQAMDARVTAEEDGTFPGMVATHEVQITADVADRDAASSSPASRIVITPEAGVEVLATSAGGSTITIFSAIGTDPHGHGQLAAVDGSGELR